MDIKRLSVPQLRQLAANARARNREDIAVEAEVELFERGEAKAGDFKSISWNQERVRLALHPFREIAKQVKANKRTPYTEAGGRKIDRSKDHPDWLWIDTYSAIKTDLGNAVIYCYIVKPGLEPEFGISVNDVKLFGYGPDNLDAALDEWQRIASELSG